MSSDSNLPEFGEGSDATTPASEPEQTQDGQVADAKAPFSSGERMVAFAGILVLIVYLIFEVIASRYSLTTVTVVLAAVAVALPRLDRDSVEKIAPLPVLMKATGYLLAVVGIVEIITDVRFGDLGDFMRVLGALGAYAGFALAFLGARSIEN